MSLTVNTELDAIARCRRCQRHVKSSGADERPMNVTHRVDLRRGAGHAGVLSLLPDDWVVEQVEVVHVELTVQPQRLPNVQCERSTFRYHHQNRYNSIKRGYKAIFNITRLMVSRFYRAMHFGAKRGIAIACRLSVCPSVRPSVRLSVCDVGEL